MKRFPFTVLHTIKVFIAIVLITALSAVNTFSQCITGNCINGQGKMMFKDSSHFEGEFKNGQLMQGTFTYNSGDVYTGHYSQNKKSGYGEYSFRNGDVFKGEFLEDKKFYGSYSYENGSEYHGGFKDNKPHGMGSFFTRDRKAYSVIYDNGKMVERFEFSSNSDTLTISNTIPKSFNISEKFTKPNVYAVIVGIADYEGNGSDLRYSDDDASIFYNNLKQAMPGETSSGKVTLLLNKDATKEKVLGALRSSFNKAGPNDYVIFYFSGHGAPGYFCPYNIQRSQINHKDVASVFESSRAKFKLCIADACFSGGLSNNGYYAPNVTQNLLDERLALIMSSKPNQTSIESSDIKQGYFSYYLVKGMMGRGDLNKDSYVTMGELFLYTKKMVEMKSNGSQVPVIFGKDLEKIPLSRVQ